MIALEVPFDHSLTHADNAMECWVVTDDEVLGVYPNVNRAIAYIKDWLIAGEMDLSGYAVEEMSAIEWVFRLNGHVLYTISRSHFVV